MDENEGEDANEGEDDVNADVNEHDAKKNEYGHVYDYMVSHYYCHDHSHTCAYFHHLFHYDDLDGRHTYEDVNH